MQFLNRFIVSYRPKLWQNTFVPTPWLQWHKIMERIQNNNGIIVEANCINQFLTTTKFLLPHLDEDQRSELYYDAKEGNYIYFAAPPLINSNCLNKQLLSVHRPIVMSNTTFGNCNSNWNNQNKLNKYIIRNNKISGSDISNEPAMNYAEEHWSKILCDPDPKLTKIKYTFDTNTLYVTTDRIISNRYINDDDIVTITHDSCLDAEIDGINHIELSPKTKLEYVPTKIREYMNKFK
jgi:hypothetical protein